MPQAYCHGHEHWPRGASCSMCHLLRLPIQSPLWANAAASPTMSYCCQLVPRAAVDCHWNFAHHGLALHVLVWSASVGHFQNLLLLSAAAAGLCRGVWGGSLNSAAAGLRHEGRSSKANAKCLCCWVLPPLETSTESAAGGIHCYCKLRQTHGEVNAQSSWGVGKPPILIGMTPSQP